MTGIVMLLANLDGSVGGAQRQARLLASEIAQRRVPVFVVSQSLRLRRTTRAGRGDGVDEVALPILGWLSRGSFFAAFLLWATVNRRHFDVIHAHSTAAGLTAGLVGRLLGKPVVVKVTGMQAVAALADRGPTWRLRRWVLDQTTAVLVAVSNEMMQALSDIGVARDRRVLIPNGVRPVPLATATGAVTKRKWLGDTVGPVVLYVGRLEDVKGVKRLLPMWSALPLRDTATLAIVGDGPLRVELEREAAERGLGRSVRFLGTQPDARPFYLAADVFVLPSLSEGLSNALLEAMAARLPVVAADVGGNRDVVEDGVSGILVDWANVSASAGCVGRLLEDAALRRRLGEAAGRRAGAFSIATVAECYRRLYQNLGSPTRALPATC